MNTCTASSRLPISVVIPTRHRNAELTRCLESLAPGRQRGPAGSYEVIVADAGTEPTAEVLVNRQFPWARYIAAPGAWPGANRNRGAAAARGEWIAFVDDDCTAVPSFLEALLSATLTRASVIEGRITCPDPVDRLLCICPDNGKGGHFWTANLSVEREAFQRLGGFDEDFERGEDLEFAHRFRAAGLTTIFASEMIVLHPRQHLTLQGFFQRTLQDRWKLLVRIKTGTAKSLGAPDFFAASSLAWCEFTNLVRMTWHLASKPNQRTMQTRYLDVIWKWATFPVMLPYLLWWELQFRHELKAKAASLP